MAVELVTPDSHDAIDHTGIPGVGSTALILPTFVAVGTSATGTGAITPGLPSGHTENDILLLFVQTDNQAITCAGYTQLGPAPGIGTAAAAGATRLTVFWKRDGGSETDPTTSDSGDHQVGQIMAIRGCPTTGDPFLNIGVVRKATASTTGTASAGATPVDACLVVNAFVHALDSATAVFSSFTNADLASVTERIDVATADGNGGGIGVCTGEKAKAGNFAATTVTETSTIDLAMTFILLPAGITSRQGFIDRQVFVTPGASSDTWIKPTAARQICSIAIGGGASGSAGRNASVAAGGGGGGGGMFREVWTDASYVASSVAITVGVGGAATANTDGAASNAGTATSATGFAFGQLGAAAGVSATGSGGLGGNGAGFGPATATGVASYGNQGTGGGTGGTTAGAGGNGQDFGGGAGAGGGTTQATSAGGNSQRGGGGGGGGRANTNVGTGGAGSGSTYAGGATAGAVGTSATNYAFGGGGGAGGTSAAGAGGAGGWPGGGGGGGGSESGAQRGGAGGDGVMIVTTFC